LRGAKVSDESAQSLLPLATESTAKALGFRQPPGGLIPAEGLPFPTIYEDIWSVLRGFRNGAVYGVKIRLPHAFVMTLLFSKASYSSKATSIIKKTQEHSLNLGKYVALYKLVCVLVRRLLVRSNVLSASQAMGSPIVHAMGGFLAGGYIWGARTSVKHQINLYVLSRVIFGLARLGIKRGVWKDYGSKAYYVFAAIIWALVMFLYEYESDTLSRSLKASMDYLYHNEVHMPVAVTAESLKDFATFTHH
jgi:peroxisomal membrane protein 4